MWGLFEALPGRAAAPTCAAAAACSFRRWPLGPLPLLQLESQKRMVESTLRRAAFTAAQLDEMPGDVATYRSVGKA